MVPQRDLETTKSRPGGKPSGSTLRCNKNSNAHGTPMTSERRKQKNRLYNYREYRRYRIIIEFYRVTDSIQNIEDIGFYERVVKEPLWPT